MAVLTVSSKYQVVIPKLLRRELGIKPGQKIHILPLKKGSLEITTNSALDAYVGILKGAWGPDSDAYIRNERDSWDN